MKRISLGGIIIVLRMFEENWVKKKEGLASAEKIAMVRGDNFLVRKLNVDIIVLLDKEARMWN